MKETIGVSGTFKELAFPARGLALAALPAHRAPIFSERIFQAAKTRQVWADRERTGPVGWREVQLDSETRPSPRKALNVSLVWMVMEASLPGPSAPGQIPRAAL